MKYVYELKDSDGKVIDVGQTKRPDRRLWEHTSKLGRWPGRTDISLEVVAGPMSISEALAMEGELKLSHGFIWTERIACLKGARAPKHKKRKLSNKAIKDIRKKEIYQRDYAKKYGVSQRTIVQIQHRLTYKDV